MYGTSIETFPLSNYDKHDHDYAIILNNNRQYYFLYSIFSDIDSFTILYHAHSFTIHSKLLIIDRWYR